MRAAASTTAQRSMEAPGRATPATVRAARCACGTHHAHGARGASVEHRPGSLPHAHPEVLRRPAPSPAASGSL
jgi:hypothetical protein